MASSLSPFPSSHPRPPPREQSRSWATPGASLMLLPNGFKVISLFTLDKPITSIPLLLDLKKRRASPSTAWIYRARERGNMGPASERAGVKRTEHTPPAEKQTPRA